MTTLMSRVELQMKGARGLGLFPNRSDLKTPICDQMIHRVPDLATVDEIISLTVIDAIFYQWDRTVWAVSLGPASGRAGEMAYEGVRLRDRGRLDGAGRSGQLAALIRGGCTAERSELGNGEQPLVQHPRHLPKEAPGYLACTRCRPVAGLAGAVSEASHNPAPRLATAHTQCISPSAHQSWPLDRRTTGQDKTRARAVVVRCGKRNSTYLVRREAAPIWMAWWPEEKHAGGGRGEEHRGRKPGKS
ncbi:hypothetical protein JX265_009726 [Neoarthrinium moseri]|uniref:Uncharacterized protein n=1 Tax=Neoarthrinium moseri TaxID=1658444 RepID=A0A9Q0AJ19_9PEZI|nr:hypothetical protein JX265_009726 [Neoarthrinium moseri]